MQKPRTLTLEDRPRGVALHGELIIAGDWTASLDAVPAGDDFRIVALTRSANPVVHHPAVAVLTPAIRRVAEPATAYAGAERDLDGSLIPALRGGRVITSAGASAPPGDLFLGDGPHWETLLRLLLPEEMPAWQRATAAALGCPIEAAAAGLRALLARVGAEGQLLPAAGSSRAAVREAAGRLDAALSPAEGKAPSHPAQIADDVYFLCAWLDLPGEAARLLELRLYLELAQVPTALVDLALDRAITREQLSFGTLLAEPHRMAAMGATFEYLRRRYRAFYEGHHRALRETEARLAEGLPLVGESARALSLLNSIEGLGPPLAAAALREFERFAALTAPCAGPDALPEGEALCPLCGRSLTDEAPTGRAADISARIGRALDRHQRRLATRAVRRILDKKGDERGSDRIDRFLRVAQASDVTALAEIMDEELATFLRDLLVDAPPQVDLPPRLRALARRFPRVGRDDIDTVTESLREELTAALDERPPAAGRPR
ncbi:MAG: hypothetical protein EXR43_00560 [Dehalococcoidia bacterium]|nr:hypothetical protein [Dehalococcoidia bacterium]